MTEENQNDAIKLSSENNVADDKPVESETSFRQQNQTLTPEETNSQLAPGNHLLIISTILSSQDIAHLI